MKVVNKKWIFDNINSSFNKNSTVSLSVKKIINDIKKNAFVIENPKPENINGSEPKRAILNQDNAVNRNACCKLSFFSWSKLDKKNKVPKTIVTIEAPKKDESIWL